MLLVCSPRKVHVTKTYTFVYNLRKKHLSNNDVFEHEFSSTRLPNGTNSLVVLCNSINTQTLHAAEIMDFLMTGCACFDFFFFSIFFSTSDV